MHFPIALHAYNPQPRVFLPTHANPLCYTGVSLFDPRNRGMQQLLLFLIRSFVFVFVFLRGHSARPVTRIQLIIADR